MGLRQRKSLLVSVLQAHLKGKLLDEKQVETFRLMYARCRTPEEQDEVTKIVRAQFDGWKDENDRFSKILRMAHDDGDDDEDDDPPSLKAALARSRVRLSSV